MLLIRLVNGVNFLIVLNFWRKDNKYINMIHLYGHFSLLKKYNNLIFGK